jgi:hypothetical protein
VSSSDTRLHQALNNPASSSRHDNCAETHPHLAPQSSRGRRRDAHDNTKYTKRSNGGWKMTFVSPKAGRSSSRLVSYRCLSTASSTPQSRRLRTSPTACIVVHLCPIDSKMQLVMHARPVPCSAQCQQVAIPASRSSELPLTNTRPRWASLPFALRRMKPKRYATCFSTM